MHEICITELNRFLSEPSPLHPCLVGMEQWNGKGVLSVDHASGHSFPKIVALRSSHNIYRKQKEKTPRGGIAFVFAVS